MGEDGATNALFGLEQGRSNQRVSQTNLFSGSNQPPLEYLYTSWRLDYRPARRFIPCRRNPLCFLRGRQSVVEGKRDHHRHPYGDKMHSHQSAVAEQEATSKSEWYPFISAAIHHRRKLNGSYRQIVVEQQIIQMPPCHTQTDDYSPSVLLHKVFSRASGSTHLSSDRIPNTRTNDRSCSGNVKQSRWVGTSVLT